MLSFHFISNRLDLLAATLVSAFCFFRFFYSKFSRFFFHNFVASVNRPASYRGPRWTRARLFRKTFIIKLFFIDFIHAQAFAQNNYARFGCHSILFRVQRIAEERARARERDGASESTIQATLVPILNPGTPFACTDERMPRKIESSLSRPRRRWIDRWYFNLFFCQPFRLYLFYIVVAFFVFVRWYSVHAL